MFCAFKWIYSTLPLAKSLSNMLHVALRLLAKAQGQNIDSLVSLHGLNGYFMIVFKTSPIAFNARLVLTFG